MVLHSVSHGSVILKCSGLAFSSGMHARNHNARFELAPVRQKQGLTIFYSNYSVIREERRGGSSHKYDRISDYSPRQGTEYAV